MTLNEYIKSSDLEVSVSGDMLETFISNNDDDGYENDTQKVNLLLIQILSRLFHLVYFVKCWQMFLELNSKRLCESSGKEKESCCLGFMSSTKREFRHFHLVVQRRHKMYKKA